MADYIDLDRKFLPVEADKENDPESIRTIGIYVILIATHKRAEEEWDRIISLDEI
jgi:hypothetical protein